MTGRFLKDFRCYCCLTKAEGARILEVPLEDYQSLEKENTSIIPHLRRLTGKLFIVSYLYFDK
ncbi:hypothetical protein [Enterococcus olivae]